MTSCNQEVSGRKPEVNAIALRRVIQHKHPVSSATGLDPNDNMPVLGGNLRCSRTGGSLRRIAERAATGTLLKKISPTTLQAHLSIGT